ncbi:hypothetical protein HPP92_027001 [Vanilla planifolia]|uniref:Uncharacterized protein n=1 Tax=Vanilla planifolia TaxID=51239 RepID=A0A835U6B1_VANPL|nr:hypothetical protein HPP92_027001 [Vanilla planifolia]
MESDENKEMILERETSCTLKRVRSFFGAVSATLCGDDVTKGIGGAYPYEPPSFGLTLRFRSSPIVIANIEVDEVGRMEAVVRLPCTSDLSQSLLNFLAEEFKTPEDLSRSSVVESELQKRCSDIESSLSNLRSRLSDRISVYAAHSSNVSTVVGGVRAALVALQTRGRGFI